MPCFSVWAPEAKAVDLLLEERRLPMRPADRGWWMLEHDVAVGTRYRFSLDGGPPLPDPRSCWQPEGILGPSALVDHAAYAWHDRGWQPPPWQNAVVYELHIGTFTPAGTFRAAVDHLDHVVDLGVTHVELMPVNEFSGRHGWGYDGVDLWAPQHSYGTPQDLKLLVDECHQRGLAVLLDVVYNHLGPAGNFLPLFGPYLTDRYHTVWGAALNLDGPGSDEVRSFVCENACMWLRDYHFDGLRLDATDQIIDTRAINILEQLSADVERLQQSLGRPLLLIAENDQNNPRLVWPRPGGFGLHGLWLDNFHHALHAVLTGESAGYYADYGPLAHLARSLREAFVFSGTYSAFRQRSHGRPARGLHGSNFVVCLQNHDQIGNRAVGDRISDALSPQRLKVGAAIVLTSPFIPLLFQGEEWAASTPFQYFSDHADPELARAVSAGRCNEFKDFGWPPEKVPNPQAPETFARSKLNWQERAQSPHAEILDWYRALIRLRRSTPALQAGPFEELPVEFSEEGGWICFRRGNVAVAANLGTQPQRVQLRSQVRRVYLQSDGCKLEPHGVQLPSDAVVVVECADEL